MHVAEASWTSARPELFFRGRPARGARVKGQHARRPIRVRSGCGFPHNPAIPGPRQAAGQNGRKYARLRARVAHTQGESRVAVYMARRQEHVLVGVAASALIGCTQIQAASPPKAFAEMLGVLAGGYVGSRTPDILEPPTQPKHWGVAHSVSTGIVLLALTKEVGPQLHGALREIGETCFRWQGEWAADGSELASVVCCLSALALYGLAGFTVGFPVGYLSHLGLDMKGCKSNLPLIGGAVG